MGAFLTHCDFSASVFTAPGPNLHYNLNSRLQQSLIDPHIRLAAGKILRAGFFRIIQFFNHFGF